MTLRTRVLAVGAVVAVLPLAAFAVGLRGFVTGQIRAQHTRRVDDAVGRLERDLGRQSERIAHRLASITEVMRTDDQLRALLTTGGPQRTYLLDFGMRAVALSGLSVLQIQDQHGRVLSSGHFRNEFDRLDRGLLSRLRHGPGSVLFARLRTAEGSTDALVRIDSVDLGAGRFFVIGGVPWEPGLDAGFGGADVDADLVRPNGAAAPVAAGDVVRELSLPFFDDLERADPDARATIVVRHDDADLAALQTAMDRWFGLAAAISVLFGLGIAAWLAGVITRPLRQLARETGRVDLDHLDVHFAHDRNDEVGSLSRLLGGMVQRLKTSRHRLQEVERRATMGELARQINHDIKNGLVPIRNVVHHLSEVATDNPDALAAVYRERSATLEASIGYLENLSANYARLSPTVQAAPCDVNAVLRDVVERLGPRSDVTVTLAPAASRPLVSADQLMLRRVIANLLSNALEVLEGGTGSVRVTAETRNDVVSIAVEDTGPGMTQEHFDRAFDDFFTTKPDGTGLGLSIVRRLVGDMHGTVRMETESGTGTRVVVELPAASREPPA